MKADYGWVVLVVFVVAIALAWKPLSGVFGSASDKMSNKDQYERGKAAFYSDTVWPAGGPNKSCAACHAADFVPTGTTAIEMMDYREGQPYPLTKLRTKYGNNLMAAKDELYDAVNRCLTGSTRMFTGGSPPDSDNMKDLLAYLRREFK